ncbi:MAG: hypothetical protein ACTHOM_08285 [Allomuricauda sp.]|uniref:Uncharacterized protein n=1 Tax=Flagellimonas profundi TaxID=2915620 RepID=A0ABS3FCU0_9FLAO|nr:hypothetical protein [Allomuricauda profundi]MBO0340963.1 hypothetical protein [Allomuricauda profundi]
MKYPINREYPLYANEYSFEIDQNNNFRLTQLKDNKSMLLGTIVEKTYLDYPQCHLYKIKLPKAYKASHEYSRGIFPYYVPVGFSIMSSGGLKYSSETRITLISAEGDTLKLYTSSGHIMSNEKTGIY